MTTTMHSLHNGPPDQGHIHAGRVHFVLLRATFTTLCTFTDIFAPFTLIEEKCKMNMHDCKRFLTLRCWFGASNTGAHQVIGNLYYNKRKRV